MSCDYPCHICDPEAWEEESSPQRSWDDLAFDIERAFDGQTKNFDRVGEARTLKAPIWWILLTPWPSDIDFTIEQDLEDIFLGSTHPVRTLLTNQRTYMHTGGRKYLIQSYRQRADFEKQLFWIDAIQTVEPPQWGWWMPLLWGG